MGPFPASVRFGAYELRPRSRELYKLGTKLKLRPQPFQVLHILVNHPADVVTRELLRQQLWPADTFVDFEHSLNTAIKELRAVLDDSATEPRYIETIPKLGYRFIFPIEPRPPVAQDNQAVEQLAVAPVLHVEVPTWLAPNWTSSSSRLAQECSSGSSATDLQISIVKKERKKRP